MKPAPPPLKVRIGINAGTPVERGGDLFGMTIQLAARICNHAEAEQILAAGIIQKLCKDDSLLAAFSDAGKRAVKGFDSALHVYEIGWGSSRV